MQKNKELRRERQFFWLTWEHLMRHKPKKWRDVEAIAREAGLQDHEWLLSYPSRLGREPWLQPSTDKTLEQLARMHLDREAQGCARAITVASMARSCIVHGIIRGRVRFQQTSE